MNRLLAIVAVLTAAPVLAQTQLTVYNRDFATVKETRTLDLKEGENEVRVSDITAHLEPDSVILRDLKDPAAIRILEQNYESDPLSEGLESVSVRPKKSGISVQLVALAWAPER